MDSSALDSSRYRTLIPHSHPPSTRSLPIPCHTAYSLDMDTTLPCCPEPSWSPPQEPLQSTVYLNSMAVEYNVSFPHAAQWTFSVQNASLRELQAPLGQSFSCRNASIILSPAFHLDLLFLKLQAARLPTTGAFGPSFSCPSDQSILLPLIIGLIALGLLAVVLVIFCICRRRPPTYQPL